MGAEEGALQHVQIHALVLRAVAHVAQPEIDEIQVQCVVRSGENKIRSGQIAVDHVVVVKPRDILPNQLHQSSQGRIVFFAQQPFPDEILHRDTVGKVLQTETIRMVIRVIDGWTFETWKKVQKKLPSLKIHSVHRLEIKFK